MRANQPCARNDSSFSSSPAHTLAILYFLYHHRWSADRLQFLLSIVLHLPTKHRWGLNANEFLSKKRKLICRFYQHLPPWSCLPKGVLRGCFKCTNCEKVTTKWRPEASQRSFLEDAPEFNDTLKYIDNIRSKAEPYRICRIVPSSSWRPHCPFKENNVCTHRSWKRPYGVGLLVAGLDESRAHLYYNFPSGNYFEYQAFAIGARSQSAKTCLDRKFESFANSTRHDLIKDALFAIKETLQGEKLTSSICTVAVIGLEEDFHILDQKTMQEFIELLETREDAPVQEEAEVPPPAPMDIGDL
ncbi:hypothetical protein C5167_039105 [Papaver somniferum]|uniref:JmjN domain-containing protein n=1 Tax=Papaver somniferum TaxID=3469 RepID=A0A4Y7IEH1_PAPSO|nr:hypothetical protein C5167_039105 [Papaver somniferum]